MELVTTEISRQAVGLRLARITAAGDLLLCEPVRFVDDWVAVETVLRRAARAGRVEVDGKVDKHFADALDEHGNIIQTVALDARSYRSLKTRWMRCRLDPEFHPRGNR